MNFKIFFNICETFHLLLAFLLLLPLLWCFYFEINEQLGIWFILSAVVMATMGLLFRRLGRGAPSELLPRDAIGIVTYTWLALAITGALPYRVSGAVPDLADAFFESVSGFTTTGSTILTDIESLPTALHFWRTLSQWIGGLGVVVLFVSIFPSLGVGGKSLFKMEVPGPITESVTPKIKDTSRNLWYTYLGLTVLETILLRTLGDLSWFDALTHSFTTVATAGFSTKNASIAAFQSSTVEWIIIVFMFLAGANFGLYYVLSKGQWRVVLRDAELRFYGILALIAAGVIAFMLWLGGYQLDEKDLTMLETRLSPALVEQLEQLEDKRFYEEDEFLKAIDNVSEENLSQEAKAIIVAQADRNYSLHRAVRSALFQVLALITTTGFSSDDYERFPVSGHLILFFLLLTGGCAGSTAGGFKLFRIVLMAKTLFHEIQMSFRPALVSKIRVGSTIISAELIRPVLAFTGVYFAFVILGALFLGFQGHDILTSLAAAMTAVGNVGPAFGTVGPSENFAHFSMEAKYLLAILMLLGRLEFFTILGVLHYKFWVR